MFVDKLECCEKHWISGDLRKARRKRSKAHAGVAQLAEQLICNQQVVGSSPITGSKQFNTGRFQSGQMDQTVNLTSSTSVVRIHLCPPKPHFYS